MESPFTFADDLIKLFGSHAGTRLSDRLTYIPTGTIETLRGFHSGRYLRMNGCRTFPASDWTEMEAWMQQYDPSAFACFHV